MLVDQHGNQIQSNYSSAKSKISSQWQRPRYVSFNNNGTNNFKSLDPTEKTTYHQLARDLFRSSPSIRAAITRKNSWACANGWTPKYKGVDQAYGKLILDYLQNVVYPNCNIAGGNYSFNRTLTTISNEIDVGGDCLVAFVVTRDNLLRLSLYPSSNVAQRNTTLKTVEAGRYKGNSIYDGVVYDTNLTPIAYSLLGETKEDDYFISARNSQLLFEPEEGQMFRGVSCIAASLIDALNTQDITDYLSRTVKLQSKMGIQIGTGTGTGEEYVSNYGGIGAAEANTEATDNTPVIQDMGDFIFFNSKENEGAKSFEPKQPGTGVPEWLRGIEEKVLYNIGWHLALISPNSIGSYAARIMESQVQQMISSRQQTLKRIAKTYCLASIARAIDNGDLPPSATNDWRNIDFHLPPSFVIDQYYSQQTAMQQWEKGNNSLSNITAKDGIDWLELRQQRETEADDALERADRLTKKYNITMTRALDLITKQVVSSAPVQETVLREEV